MGFEGKCGKAKKILAHIGDVCHVCAMRKPIEEIEIRRITRAVGSCRGPAAIEEITARMDFAPPRRTLQRRLAQMVHEGILSANGDRKGRRYSIPAVEPGFLREPERTYGKEPIGKMERDEVLPLSPEALEIRNLVTRPEAKRKPVGYNHGFLTDYQPNVTHLLPAAMRRRLLEMGRTNEEPLPAGTYLRKVMDRLLIDLSWNSSRLEGNTYSLLETQRLLEHGESADGRRTEETQMLLNHKAAIELLAEQSGEIGFDRYTICSLHALLSDNLLPDQASGGRLRRHPVGIGRSVYRPLDVPQVIEERFDMFLEKARAIRDPFEQAFFAMVHLPYLQPFEDVNKRVSRLAANIPLVKHNLCPLSFTDVPREDYVHAVLGVYELNRIEYLRDAFEWAYERSCARHSAIIRVFGQPDPFRLRYRSVLTEVVGDVVRGAMSPKQAVAFLNRRVPELAPPPDREKVIHLAELELYGLHEGNFARFRVRPSEFAKWQETWRSPGR